MRVVVGALVALGAGCLDAPPGSIETGGTADAARGDDGAAAADGAPCTGSDWSVPEEVPGLSGVLVSAPTVSADGQLMVYVAGPDLAVATWNGTTYVPGGGVLVAALNTADDENGPSLSRDGLTLWFLREGFLWVAKRTAGDDFSNDQPVAGVEEIEMLGPEILEDATGLSLFYSPTGDSPDPDTIFLGHCSDAATCAPPAQVTELDESGNERFPTLSGDGREIIFRSSAVPGLVSYRRPAADEQFEQRSEIGVDAVHPELAFGNTTLFVVIDDELYMMTRDCE